MQAARQAAHRLWLRHHFATAFSAWAAAAHLAAAKRAAMQAAEQHCCQHGKGATLLAWRAIAAWRLSMRALAHALQQVW